MSRRLLALSSALLAGCLSPDPAGLALAPEAAVSVKMDFLHRPLPEIPLPNDVATRYDPTSATGRRVNASMIAPTRLERQVREKIDELDGWGANQPITIPFTGPLDIDTILAAHRDPHYGLSDDLVYLVDVTEGSPDFGSFRRLDFGEGNFPVVLEDIGGYWKNDPRGWTNSLFFDEADEDLNGNGVLDPGEDANGNRVLDEGEDTDGDGELDLPEDTDADGVLDVPNYVPGAKPARDDLAGRADALMSFYERETNTLIVRPVVPLRERTTYAVLVTRRLLDAEGRPVGSPFEAINDTSQTEALQPVRGILGRNLARTGGLTVDDLAFAFTFTTQSFQSHWVAVRDGLYGFGVQKHLAAEYPARLSGIDPLRDLTHARFAGQKNAYILRTEDWIGPFALLAQALLAQDPTTREYQSLFKSHQYVDYHVVGQFDSPQLFDREDEDGELSGTEGPNFLPLNSQSWPGDLDRKPVKARRESIRFWLTIPRKEVSARGEGKQVPLVIVGHGYGSARFESVQFAGYFAKKGIASLAIDCPSHGLGLNEMETRLATSLIGTFGLTPLIDAVLAGRSLDQNNDGVADSGADFWTAYIFHTRDLVRQCGLDYMQLIRVFRSFDGERRWAFDVDDDGDTELAGDFDGDGNVDVGIDSVIGFTGGSLGGIMATLVGAIEPEVTVTAPISGGGGLGDIGNRSLQGGVREAVILRVMGPLFVGTLDGEGALLVEAIVPDLNDDAVRPIARVPDVHPGDTFRVENLDNGEVGCGYVSPEGTVRAAAEADMGDRMRVRLFSGPRLVTGSDECALMPGSKAFATVDTFEIETEFQEEMIPEGATLIALADGFGERRGSPGMRRFLALGQLVLDGGDPSTYARNLLSEPLVYPGTGQQTGTHSLIVTTTGDMNVPASSGVAVARAAGLVDYIATDPRYGTTQNQMLLNTGMAEAVHTLKRYTDPAGHGVHIDVDGFSRGGDLWGADIPRLDPPMRFGMEKRDALGGFSGAIFPYTIPTGQHGFAFPGGMSDARIKMCKERCAEGADCGCDTVEGFDIGWFMFNMLGEYLATGGQVLRPDLCHSRDDCEGTPEPPPPRE